MIWRYFRPIRNQKTGLRHECLEMENLSCKNIYNHPSRAHAYARITSEFYHFCCHKYHTILCNTLSFSKLQHTLGHILKIYQLNTPKSNSHTPEKTGLFPFNGSFYPPFSFRLLHSLWHLWQQKIKIAVERVRVTRTREELLFYFCAFFAFLLLLIIRQIPCPIILQTPPIT